MEKIKAGADFIVTQFFYDADVFLAYVQRCRDAGITCPIIPGLMPIHVRACVRVGVWTLWTGPVGGVRWMDRGSRNQTKPNQTYRTFERMTAFCKTRVPQEMWDELLPIKDDDEAVKNWGIEYMTKLCR